MGPKCNRYLKDSGISCLSKSSCLCSYTFSNLYIVCFAIDLMGHIFLIMCLYTFSNNSQHLIISIGAVNLCMQGISSRRLLQTLMIYFISPYKRSVASKV